MWCAQSRNHGSTAGHFVGALMSAARNACNSSERPSAWASSSIEANSNLTGNRCLPHFRVSISSQVTCQYDGVAASNPISLRNTSKSAVGRGRPKGIRSGKYSRSCFGPQRAWPLTCGGAQNLLGCQHGRLTNASEARQPTRDQVFHCSSKPSSTSAYSSRPTGRSTTTF